MPRRVLITTTIRVPRNLREWRRVGFLDDDDVFIVAGDHRSPHDDILAFLNTLPGQNVYLHPDLQTAWHCSDVIGWNSIQRRNIALLAAIQLNPDWIITVDDDNWPVDPRHAWFLDNVFDNAENITESFNTVMDTSGWFNVCERLNEPCVHRGYPLTKRRKKSNPIDYRREQSIGVFASLWLGEPDIDAIQRLNKNVTVRGMVDSETGEVNNIILESGTWCPFNSQATAYRTDLAPLMSVWPGVGRYDDIWSSYLARAVMDAGSYRVAYGAPMVRQDRNPHNFINDLKEEMLGLEHTENLCAVLRSINTPTLENCFNVISAFSFIPDQTKRFFNAWLDDLREIGVL